MSGFAWPYTPSGLIPRIFLVFKLTEQVSNSNQLDSRRCDVGKVHFPFYNEPFLKYLVSSTDGYRRCLSKQSKSIRSTHGAPSGAIRVKLPVFFHVCFCSIKTAHAGPCMTPTHLVLGASENPIQLFEIDCANISDGLAWCIWF